MAVYQLNEDLWFPDPHEGESDGLIAIGGDLSVNRLVLAYCHGIFPWFSYKDSTPLWFCPMERYVIFPREIHISHSMRQLLRSARYEVTINQDFDGVIHGCSMAGGRHLERGAWLGPDMIQAYTRLHQLGFAASVEVWEPAQDTVEDPERRLVEDPERRLIEDPERRLVEDPERRLVGGLYGVVLRNAFFGESMFSLVPNASKLALIHLAHTLDEIGAHFIDCQFETPHLRSMGARPIPYDEYMRILNG